MKKKKTELLDKHVFIQRVKNILLSLCLCFVFFWTGLLCYEELNVWINGIKTKAKILEIIEIGYNKYEMSYQVCLNNKPCSNHEVTISQPEYKYFIDREYMSLIFYNKKPIKSIFLELNSKYNIVGMILGLILVSKINYNFYKKLI